MGSELGSLVAVKLEAEPWVGALVGIDVDPPRRRLHKAEFHLLQPSQRERIVDVVTKFNPHVVINLSVWEPDARANLVHARQFTADATTAVIGAAAECPALEGMVVRSGIEIYGRERNSATRPSENAPLRPTSEYGHMLANIEKQAREVGRGARGNGSGKAAVHGARPGTGLAIARAANGDCRRRRGCRSSRRRAAHRREATGIMVRPGWRARGVDRVVDKPRDEV